MCLQRWSTSGRVRVVCFVSRLRPESFRENPSLSERCPVLELELALERCVLRPESCGRVQEIRNERGEVSISWV